MSLSALSACHFTPGCKNEGFNSLPTKMRCRKTTNNRENLITPPEQATTLPTPTTVITCVSDSQL